MSKTTGISLAAAAAVAVAVGYAALPSASAAAEPSCKNANDAYPVGSPPVVSYYCTPMTPGHDGMVQLDVYIGATRNGPNYLPCDQQVLPPPVYTLFCSG